MHESRRDRGFTQPQSSSSQGSSTAQRTGDGARREEASTGVLGTIKEKAQDLASSVTQRAEDAWDSTRQGAQRMGASVSDTAEEAWDSVTGFINRHPIPTLLIGFGVGFILAASLLGGVSGSRRRW